MPVCVCFQVFFGRKIKANSGKWVARSQSRDLGGESGPAEFSERRKTLFALRPLQGSDGADRIIFRAKTKRSLV